MEERLISAWVPEDQCMISGAAVNLVIAVEKILQLIDSFPRNVSFQG